MPECIELRGETASLLAQKEEDVLASQIVGRYQSSDSTESKRRHLTLSVSVTESGARLSFEVRTESKIDSTWTLFSPVFFSPCPPRKRLA